MVFILLYNFTTLQLYNFTVRDLRSIYERTITTNDPKDPNNVKINNPPTIYLAILSTFHVSVSININTINKTTQLPIIDNMLFKLSLFRISIIIN